MLARYLAAHNTSLASPLTLPHVTMVADLRGGTASVHMQGML
jgi:hypothetical protein